MPTRQNNSRESQKSRPTALRLTSDVQFSQSLTDIINSVREAVYARYDTQTTYSWVKDIYNDYAIVEVTTDQSGEKKLYNVPWSFDDSGEVVLGEGSEVEEIYVPVGASAAFAQAPEMVVREAKLLEVGDYPDKGMTLTEADLDNLIQNFDSENTPIKIQHDNTAFDGFLGKVVAVWRKGGELFGRLSIPEPLWALAEWANAKRLSVGLTADKLLGEVSIVEVPRVKSAEIFCFDHDFIPEHYLDGLSVVQATRVATHFAALVTSSGIIKHRGGDSKMDPKNEKNGAAGTPPEDTVTTTEFAAQMKQKDDEIAKLKLQFRESEVKSRVKDLLSAGKITPAVVPLVTSIFMGLPEAQVKVTFAEGEEPKDASLSQALEQLFDKLPKAVEFSETAGESAEEGGSTEPAKTGPAAEIAAGFGVSEDEKKAAAKYGA